MYTINYVDSDGDSIQFEIVSQQDAAGVFEIIPSSKSSTLHCNKDNFIGVAPITQLRTCVSKIVTFKGGHPMWKR